MPTITLPNGKKLVTADTVMRRHELTRDLKTTTPDGLFHASEEGFFGITHQLDGFGSGTFATFHKRYHPTIDDIEAVEKEHKRIEAVNPTEAANYEKTVVEPLRTTGEKWTCWYVPDAKPTISVTTIHPATPGDYVVRSNRVDPAIAKERGYAVDVFEYARGDEGVSRLHVQSGIGADELAVALHERGITDAAEASTIFHSLAVAKEGEKSMGGLSKPLETAMGKDIERFLSNAMRLKSGETTVEKLFQDASIAQGL